MTELRLIPPDSSGYAQVASGTTILGYVVPVARLRELELRTQAVTSPRTLTVQDSIRLAMYADQHTASEIIAFVTANTGTLETTVRTTLSLMVSKGMITRQGLRGTYTYWPGNPP